MERSTSNSSSYLWIFLFLLVFLLRRPHALLPFAVTVDELLHSSFPIFVSCHSEVSRMNNQANHEAGGGQFFVHLDQRFIDFCLSFLFFPKTVLLFYFIVTLLVCMHSPETINLCFLMHITSMHEEKRKKT